MEHTMVCVTKQKTCQRLIDYGSELVHRIGGTLHIVHVAEKNYNFLGDSEENRALTFLYEKAREAGAELTVLKADDVLSTLSSLVDEKEITNVVVGASGEKSEIDGFTAKLRLLLGHRAKLCVVPASAGAEDKKTPFPFFYSEVIKETEGGSC